MNQNEVEVKLIEVLQDIQSDGGYDRSQITGTTCPLRDLEGFDSMLCPVAISILATTLKINIPNEKNIFLSEDGVRQLTISQSAVVVCEILAREEN